MQSILQEKISRLRVVIVSDAVPQRNGVGSYYVDFTEHIEGRVQQVKLICPNWKGEKNYSKVKFAMPGDTTQIIYFPRFGYISRCLGKINPQVIIIPTPGPFGMAGFYWSRRMKTTMVTGFHTDYHQLCSMYFSRIYGFISKQYMHHSQKLLFRYSASILATSRELAQIAVNMGGKNLEMIGTPLPKKYLVTPPAPPSPALEKIIFVGRLAPEKNIGQVLDAAIHLPHLSFTIVGDGPLKKQVEQQAEQTPNLKYVGWQTREALLPLLDEHDMLVLPSHVESFGTVTLEAMSRAKNVLISPHCGLLNWPELSDIVFTMQQNEPLPSAIKRITSLPPELSRQKALSGRKAAIAFNQRSLNHWLEVLCRHIDDKS